MQHPRTPPLGRNTSSDGYLTFRLGGEVYALPLLEVTEIMEYRPLTVIPDMPPIVRGVINLRGRVVPVIDLAVRFGQGPTAVARRSSIIILEMPPQAGVDRHVGVIVDAVNNVLHLDPEDFEPSPEFGAGIRADFITGMARRNDAFVIVLDISRIVMPDQRDESAPAVPAQARHAPEG